MAFDLSPRQRQIVDTARAFALEQLRPNAAQWEARGALDREVLSVMAAIGFAGICVRQDVGGSGLTRADAVLVFEQLSRGCISTAAFMSMHNMATWMIDTFGHEQQRRQWAPRLCTMDLIASYCLTEPGAGSDAANLRTTAARVGGEYVLNGAKAFISGAGFSDVYVVMARTSDEGPRGISCFLAPSDAPGLHIGKLERKMGWKAQPMAQITFEDCRIPAVNLIGKEGSGFLYAMQALDGGRLNIAACSLGGATEALERALEYAREREQFGQLIADFQATQFKLADMATKLEAARLLVYDAAARLDAGHPDATKHCAMAKRFATDAGFEIANEALQIHGGYGYLADYEVERIVRDLRAHQIIEGANEIMRLIIARQMMGR
ncbi:MAG TPA: acyl-CoA dehydrogenase family protein [Caulobacterales bacterium]|nr:acyl-CoA dehydrogenase family protein [Caulobacterales bacterium]